MFRRVIGMLAVSVLVSVVVANCGSSVSSETSAACANAPVGGLPPLECGEGACHIFVAACDPEGHLSTCVAPEATLPETCDGVDNNCNGVVDEGCPCVTGASQSCFRGAPRSRNLGACKDGVQQCSNGVWGQCVGDVLPVAESCDKLDNDCDGVVDNGCACSDGSTQTCYDGPVDTQDKGPCHDGRQTCSSGVWGACLSQSLPQVEACDGFDNDCDGVVDNGCGCTTGATQSCYDGPQNTQGKGVCKAGNQVCVKGAWGPCTGEVVPATTEICNGIDDDCNGIIDDVSAGGTLDDGGPCQVEGALGPCSTGTKKCRNGEQECVSTYVAQAEICDNIDNDCNGKVDDGNIVGTGQLCKVDNQIGQCAVGSTACFDAQIKCAQVYAPKAETCNGLDDNCDGVVDEGGVCGPTCISPQVACGNACVDVSSDILNCGGCGKACEAVNNTSYCSGGKCVIVTCAAGFGSCDSNTYNGCETYLMANNFHCGGCNIACTSGQTCQSGTCK